MISIKKLATVGVAAGLLFGSAMPVFASHRGSGLTINQTNEANITNEILANSNTGNQSLGGGGGGPWSLSEDGDGGHHGKKGNFALGTGNAETWVDVANVANSNSADVNACGCFKKVTINQGNTANITNDVVANSNSGNQTVGKGSNKAIRTGDAFTSVAVANVVNSNVAVVN